MKTGTKTPVTSSLLILLNLCLAIGLFAGCASTNSPSARPLAERLPQNSKLKSATVDLKPCLGVAGTNSESRPVAIKVRADCSHLPHARIFGFTVMRSVKQTIHNLPIVDFVMPYEPPLRLAESADDLKDIFEKLMVEIAGERVAQTPITDNPPELTLVVDRFEVPENHNWGKQPYGLKLKRQAFLDTTVIVGPSGKSGLTRSYHLTAAHNVTYGNGVDAVSPLAGTMLINKDNEHEIRAIQALVRDVFDQLRSQVLADHELWASAEGPRAVARQSP